MEALSIGVCAWSVDRTDAILAIESARRDFAITVIQIGFFNERALEHADPAMLQSTAKAVGVEIAATFVGFEGVDRSSIAATEGTGGLRSDELRETRIAMIERAAALSAAMNVRLMATHLGAVPSDSSSTQYAALLDCTRRAADAAGSHGVTLLGETGQEPAERLRSFIEAVKRPNLGVNFDPGNLVIYGSGDSVAAVTTLADRIMLVHLKDAAASAKPGTDWGREVPLGTGDASPARVVSKLRAKGYEGPLLIERRIAESDPRETTAARLRDDLAYVRSMLR